MLNKKCISIQQSVSLVLYLLQTFFLGKDIHPKNDTHIETCCIVSFFLIKLKTYKWYYKSNLFIRFNDNTETDYDHRDSSSAINSKNIFTIEIITEI